MNKAFILSSIFSLSLSSTFSWAADENSEKLMQLLKDDKVNAAYNECREVDKASNEDLDDCIWGKLDEAKKEELKKKLALTKSSAETKESKTKYEALNLSEKAKESEKKKKDPEITKLEEFLSKRLSESLYGDIASAQSQTGSTKIVDHKVFYELYESQVSKSVLSALSSYCIIANPEDKFYIEKSKEAQKAQREKNIAALKNFSGEKGKDSATPENTSSNQWLECSSSIQKICAKEAPYDSVTEEKEKEKLNYSQKQACVVTKLIKDARQTLLKVSQIKKIMDEGDATKGVSMQGSKNVDIYTGSANPSTKSKNIDELTSISSSEFAKSGYSEGVKEKQELLKRCKESSSTEDPACQGILLSEEEAKESKKALDEYDLRTKVLEEKIKDPSKVTNEDVTDYLKEQGYNEEQIKAMIEKDVEQLKKQIANRYAQEREAIIQKLNEKLKSKTINPSTEDLKAAKESKLDELASELEGKPEELKQLIHYNNIVTGFLKIADADTGEKKDKTQKKEQEDNTVSIARELESQEGLTPEEIKQREELKKVMQEKGVKLEAKNTDRSGTNITVDDINKNLLKYDTDTASPTDAP